MKKLICHLGPGEDMPGGMLSVIKGYLDSPYMSSYKQIHIATASANNKVRTFLLGIIKLISIVKNKKVAIMHIHMSERGSCYRTIVLVTIGKLCNIPVIIHSHGSEIEKWYSSRSKAVRRLFNYAMNEAQGIIVLTPGWKQFWNKIVELDKIHILPNYVQINPYKEKEYLKNDALNIVFLGYIGERKGTYDLIKAIDILKRDGIRVFLRIGGNGEQDRCKKMIEEYSLQENIIMYGWLDQLNKQRILNESDCLVLASNFESFGIVILEAMANQMPVICGDKGYSKEIISNREDGLIAESGNPYSIAECLRELTDKKTIKRYGDAAYHKVKENYSEEKVISDLIKLYIQL